jgi:hypothetical protein
MTTHEGVTITAEEYDSQLAQRGTEDLTHFTNMYSFDGQVDTGTMYKYGEDFFMGDIVQFADEYGNESRSRVTEFIYSYSDNGVEAYPTFSVIESYESVLIKLDTPYIRLDVIDNEPVITKLNSPSIRLEES